MAAVERRSTAYESLQITAINRTDIAMTRGLLTQTEREAVKGEIDDPNSTSTYMARIRRRLEEDVGEDARLLKEHRPELYQTLREEVCQQSVSD